MIVAFRAEKSLNAWHWTKVEQDLDFDICLRLRRLEAEGPELQIDALVIKQLPLLLAPTLDPR